MPQSDKSTLRHHLSTIERVSKRWDSRLHRAPPEPMRHVWEWFREVSLGREFDEFGPRPLSNQEIHAWSCLRHLSLSVFEFQALRRLDALMLSVSAQKRN